MVVWNIENYRGDVTVTCYRAERVYDVLTERFDVEAQDALEAEGWSELATVGEVYQGEGFRIYVEEE